jgi:hypothetical protein
MVSGKEPFQGSGTAYVSLQGTLDHQASTWQAASIIATRPGRLALLRVRVILSGILGANSSITLLRDGSPTLLSRTIEGSFSNDNKLLETTPTIIAPFEAGQALCWKIVYFFDVSRNFSLRFVAALLSNPP